MRTLLKFTMSVIKPIDGGTNNSIDGVNRNVIVKSLRHLVIRKDHHVSEQVKIMRVIAEKNNSLLIPESLQGDTRTPKYGKQSRKNESVTKNIQNGFITIPCSLLIFVIGLILGIVVVGIGTKFYSAGI